MKESKGPKSRSVERRRGLENKKKRMTTVRTKYKVLRRRGINATRSLWKRTEWHHAKWRAKKTVRRVGRRGRRGIRYPVNGTYGSTIDSILQGGTAPRYGSRKATHRKKRAVRKGRKIRYGGGVRTKSVGRKRRVGVGMKARGKRPVNRTGAYIKNTDVLSEGLAPRVQERAVGRADRNKHLRGGRERKAPVRRFRSGRAETIPAAREIRKRGEVLKRGSGGNTTAPGVRKSEFGRGWSLEPGEGRRIHESRWKRRKKKRRRREYGRRIGRRNGRTARGYVSVDYRTGTRRVKRSPRSGEVRRPYKMGRSRWQRRR